MPYGSNTLSTHSGGDPRKQIPLYMPRGTNSLWEDGHVEWNVWPGHSPNLSPNGFAGYVELLFYGKVAFRQDGVMSNLNRQSLFWCKAPTK